MIMIVLQIKCVDQFVNDVNSTLRQRQDHERLKGIIARIESYDVVVSSGICLINSLPCSRLGIFTDTYVTCTVCANFYMEYEHLILPTPFMLPNQFYILTLWPWPYHQLGPSGINGISFTTYIMTTAVTESSGIRY
jgi:hypothetical protein